MRCSVGGAVQTANGPAVDTRDTFNAVSSQPHAEEGRTVFFTALQNNGSCEQEGAVSPTVDELYARVAEAKTVAISEPSKDDCTACDTSHPAAALFQGASEDGARVFFRTEQALFDGTDGEMPGEESLYEYNFNAPLGEKVSLVAPELGGVLRVSDDGGRVFLVSGSATLAGAGAANEYGAKTIAHGENLYAYNTETQAAHFIAGLSAHDAREWGPEDSHGSVEVTPDGRFLLFGSTEKSVTPGVLGETQQLYRYDAAPTSAEEQANVPRLVRISVGDAASNDGLSETSEIVTTGYTGFARPTAAPRAMTTDGAEIFFTSGGALTPTALNHACAGEGEGRCLEGTEAQNVYEYHGGTVYLLSDGRDTHPSTQGSTAVKLIGASPSGSDVYFTSDDVLAGQPGGELGVAEQYIYDARVDGGFPAAQLPGGCSAECQGSGGTAMSSSGPPASETFTGIGNRAAPGVSASKPLPLTKAQRLAGALRTCRKLKRKRKRLACEITARRRYGPTGKRTTLRHADRKART